jgi:RNA polymerase sigma factor (sigma-70 family)
MAESLSEQEVERLARLASQGDQQALATLLAGIHARVLGRCHRALPNPADAEDASQEALLLVSRRIAGFKGESSFTTWLYRLTSNTLLDTYRRLKRQAHDHGLDPEAIVARDRTSVLAGNKVDLLEAMERIPRYQAEVVMLRDFCQLEYREIAQALGVPEGTAKRRVHDGRVNLKRLIN